MASEPNREPTRCADADARGHDHHRQLVEQNRARAHRSRDAAGHQRIGCIGIVGAGLMGQSIAARAIAHGISVSILDANREAATSAAERLSQRSSTSEPSPAGSVVAVSDYRDFADTDLVIESVVETKSVKHSVLRQIESAVSDCAAFYTIVETNADRIAGLNCFL